MKIKQYSVFIYIASLIFILINITLFPKLFDKEFLINDMLDNGHSKYLEKVLSTNTKEKKLLLPIINDNPSEEIVTFTVSSTIFLN
jgi:hypothetical protein